MGLIKTGIHLSQPAIAWLAHYLHPILQLNCVDHQALFIDLHQCRNKKSPVIGGFFISISYLSSAAYPTKNALNRANSAGKL